MPFPAAREVRTEEQARAAAAELTGPFALKAVGLLHKSDAGGVVLGLPDADAVVAAFRELHARLGDMPYAVEEMADLRDGVELIVGVNRDPRFGPVAMVGVGGVLHRGAAATSRSRWPRSPRRGPRRCCAACGWPRC